MTEENRRVICMPVSPELIADGLHMPKDCSIIGAERL